MRYLLSFLLSALFAAASLVPAHASEETDALLDLLGVGEMVAIMREEGMTYTGDLAREMLPGGNSASWTENVSKIYDVRDMTLLTQGGFAEALHGVDTAPMTEFFETENGRRLIQLELSARRAMLDSDIEENAKQSARRMEVAEDERYQMVARLIDAGDMLEANVVSALNSNILFYEGLVDGGAFRLSEEEILADVWSQEDETRDETRDWLFGFFLMAYDPLPTDELAEFVAFSETEAGKALTRAIIFAYDTMYSDVSYALGRAVAQEMQAEDI